jgi:hypothetical protein
MSEAMSGGDEQKPHQQNVTIRLRSDQPQMPGLFLPQKIARPALFQVSDT